MKILNFTFRTSKPTDSAAEHAAAASEQNASLSSAHASLQQALEAFDADPSQAHESQILDARATIEKLELHASRTARLKSQAEAREHEDRVAKVKAEAREILAGISVAAMSAEVDDLIKNEDDLLRALVDSALKRRALALHRSDEVGRANQLLSSIDLSVSSNAQDEFGHWGNANWPAHGFDPATRLLPCPGDSIEMQKALTRLRDKLRGW